MGERAEGLNVFEQLEILRQEQRDRNEELTQISKDLHKVELEVMKRRYLTSLSDYYRQLPPPEGYDRLQDLRQQKKMLEDIVGKIEKLIPQLEAKAAGSTPTDGAAAAARQRFAPPTRRPPAQGRPPRPGGHSKSFGF